MAAGSTLSLLEDPAKIDLDALDSLTLRLVNATDWEARWGGGGGAIESVEERTESDRDVRLGRTSLPKRLIYCVRKKDNVR